MRNVFFNPRRKADHLIKTEPGQRVITHSEERPGPTYLREKETKLKNTIRFTNARKNKNLKLLLIVFDLIVLYSYDM